ncbi:DOPA 4,5-dioxygenase family protein [Pseudomonas aeruginosa]|uniref:DOPA 4,5-dioxygenase family protein n=1 Tax=Pseudomonas aeruginosa TaxID=287 RepID=UPI00390C86E5
MNEYSTPRIQGFHAHVYFDAQSIERARALCEEAARRFPLKMGRVHERPVGPHPDWSCQLAFAPEVFGELVPWLAIHRQDIAARPVPSPGRRRHRRACARSFRRRRSPVGGRRVPRRGRGSARPCPPGGAPAR